MKASVTPPQIIRELLDALARGRATFLSQIGFPSALAALPPTCKA